MGAMMLLFQAVWKRQSLCCPLFKRPKYNMNPLTVTWKPHVHTEIGLKNVWSFIDEGFDNYMKEK